LPRHGLDGGPVMNSRFREAAAFPVVLLLLVLLVAGLGVAASRPEEIRPAAPEVEWPSMRLCVADALKQVAVGRPGFDALHDATGLCYQHLHSQGLLNDFKLRRLKFTQQSYDERILLWMVVVITVSGVVLAGLQLLASFRLASTGVARPAGAGENWVPASDISLEQGKLSVKSSVTGLLILICSFAFFWVFVYEIFVIKIVDVDRGSAAESRKPGAVQIATGLLVPRDAASKAASAASAPAGGNGRTR
jgi:hypothetical protein